MVREYLFTTGLPLDWIQLDTTGFEVLKTENWFVMMIMMLMLLKSDNRFLILELVLDEDKEDRMTCDLGASMMNVAGSPSPVGLTMLSHPNKPKVTKSHPNFKYFNLDQ